MGWLFAETPGNGIKGDIAKALENLLGEIEKDISANGSGALEPILRSVIAGNPSLDPLLSFLAEAFLADPTLDRIADLRRYLWRIEEREEEARRRLGWKDFAQSFGATPGPFALDLKGSGDAYFLVAHSRDAGNDDATLSFLAAGKLTGKAGLNVSPAMLTASASAQVDLRRAIKYEFDYDDDLLTGLALADALSRIAAPIDDYGGMLNAFGKKPPLPGGAYAVSLRAQTLKKVTVSGNRGLVLQGEGKVAAPLSIGGTLSVWGKANYSLASGFTMTLTAPDRDALKIALTATATEGFGAELGVGYRVGIADLAPEFVLEIIRAIKGADEILKKINNDLSKAVQIVSQPGSFLKDKLKGWAKDALDADEPGLGGAFAEAIGLETATPASADLADMAADWIGRRIDALDDLLGGAGKNRLIGQLLADLKTGASNEVRDFVRDLAEKSSGWFDDTLTTAAQGIVRDALGESLGRTIKDGEKLAALRDWIGKLRSRLAEVAGALEDTGRDLLAAEIAWGRSSTDASDGDAIAVFKAGAEEAFARVVQDPSNAVPYLLTVGAVSGLTVLEGKLVQTNTKLREQRWSLAVLDLPIAGAVKRVDELKVERTLSGVSIGASRQVEKVRKLFGRERQMRIADFLSFGMDEAARLSVSIAQTEEWTASDVRAFLDSFSANGVPIGRAALAGVEAARAAVQALGAPEGTLTVGLTVPSEIAVAFIDRYLPGNDRIQRIVDTMIIQSEPILKSIIMQVQRLPDPLKFSDPILGKDAISRAVPAIQFHGQEPIINMPLLLTDAQAVLRLVRNASIYLGPGEGRQRDAIRELRRIFTGYISARDALDNYIAELKANRVLLKSVGTGAVNLRENLLDRQNDALDAMEKAWMGIGLPWKQEQRPLPVILVATLRQAIFDLTQKTIPVIVSAQFGDAPARYFLADGA